MATAINPNRTWDYVPEADRDLPTEQQTTFHLRALTPTELAAVNDLGFTYQMERGGQRAGEFRAMPATQVLKTVTCGLVGWSNLLDGRGGRVDPPADAADRVALISEELRVELAGEIRHGGQLTVSEGNS